MSLITRAHNNMLVNVPVAVPSNGTRKVSADKKRKIEAAYTRAAENQKLSANESVPKRPKMVTELNQSRVEKAQLQKVPTPTKNNSSRFVAPLVLALSTSAAMVSAAPAVSSGKTQAVQIEAPRTVTVVTATTLERSPSRGLYVFGDIHGELDGFQENLQDAGLISRTTKKWCGKKAKAIQMGDVLDRGPKSKESYAFLGQVQQEAEAAGGEFIRLLGNHELMFSQGKYYNADRNNLNPPEMAAQIKKDVISGKVQAAYFDGKRLYVHAGLRSAIRKQVEKEIMQKRGGTQPVTGKEIADHLNELLVKAVRTNNYSHAIFRVGAARSQGFEQGPGGIFWEDVREMCLSQLAREVPQVIAHNPPTRAGEKPIRMTKGMSLINTDAGLCRRYGGHQAYVKISEDKVHIAEQVNKKWEHTEQEDLVKAKAKAKKDLVKASAPAKRALVEASAPAKPVTSTTQAPQPQQSFLGWVWQRVTSWIW